MKNLWSAATCRRFNYLMQTFVFLAQKRRQVAALQKIVFVIVIVCLIIIFLQSNPSSAEEKKDEINSKLESALYTRTEFFGSEALVPYPTAEARNRLEELSKQYPNEAQIFLSLSELEEKLGNNDKAEKAMQRFIEMQSDKREALQKLADYFHRRARFDKEAETLEKLMAIEKPELKVSVMQRLFELGKTHGLKKYTEPQTYSKVVEENSSSFTLIQNYVDHLIEQNDYDEALKVIKDYKDKFPDNIKYFLEKELSALETLERNEEAEKLYHTAFEPFWSEEETNAYYSFLSDHDRLRIYGTELRTKFRNDPSSFDVAMRLYHYLTYSYYSENKPDIFSQLERQWAKRKIAWTSVELVTVTRLLIASGDGDTASRFLYTLYTNGELKKGNELRGKILYQLFELLSDAEDERLALTRGNLQFYSEVAKSDPSPGMIGGVMSLIFSDTKPQRQLNNLDEKAVKYFNRAAAFRIFTAYKEEFRISPQLAQMYLDIIRLYASNKEVEKAASVLKEFEVRYKDAPQFPEVALKLADAYSKLERREDERAIYQKILDYYGEHKKEGEKLISPSSNAELTTSSPTLLNYPFNSNPGITINTREKKDDNNYYYRKTSHYADFISEEGTNVTYQLVLERLVSLLNQDKRWEDILALYANEVKKHQDEEGLYEGWLQWLGQTKQVDEQFRVYKEALKQFNTTSWNDRMARWFLNRERNAEFEKFSRETLEKMNDDEIENYLTKFVSNGSYSKPESFQAQIYLGLYNLAHQRFPHNQAFVRGLLDYYKNHNQWEDWRKLMAEYYFESEGIRQEFLRHLAEKNELRNYLNQARNSQAKEINALPYKLFRADAAVWLANYEEAIDAYRELNRLYPHTPEFANRLVSFTRSFGQHNRKFLEESSAVQKTLADAYPVDAVYRTRSGEIQAELGNYDKAKGEWEQLIDLGKSDEQIYLDTATVYWDYYQYDDALRTIKTLRQQTNDNSIYAFQTAALYEANHNMPEALTEYAKALDENSDNYYQTKKRLKTLWRRDGVPAQFEKAFNAIGRDDDELSFGYASFLFEVKENEKASVVLNSITANSKDPKTLERAIEVYQYIGDKEGKEKSLRRLVDTAQTPRDEILYCLRLATALKDYDKVSESIALMKQLVRKFSNNYGVLDEAANFFWSVGSKNESLNVLQSAAKRSKGKFRYRFAEQLATRQLELNQNSEAQKTLEWLHKENKLDSGVFHQLARVYVRTNNQAALRSSFDETVDAIKAQDIQISDKRTQIADFREEMIEAFTRIKDYNFAIDQHIEIINRDPEDEEKIDAAIEYANRYGGAERLLDYYKKTSAVSYKNYRWNVVLARVYQADKNYEKAVQEYEAAIGNQPEMLELYDALAAIYQKTKNYDAAIETLKKTLELSNDDPQNVKRLIEVLLLARRKNEAEAERQKLPPEIKPEQTLKDKLREAEAFRTTEKEKAVATYKEAINTILAAPLKHELKAYEITGFVQTVSEAHGIHNVAQTLWTLRSKLIAECNGMESNKARAQLQLLDGAMSDSIGNFAAEKASGEELSELYIDLEKRIKIALSQRNQFNAANLLTSISRKAGFTTLEEEVLISDLNVAYEKPETDSYHTALRALVFFYGKSGRYNRILELLNNEIKRDVKAYQFEYYQTISENARLIGDSAQELNALRQHYKQVTAKQTTNTDYLIERYFSILLERGDEGRNEIRTLIQQPSLIHTLLINFLLSRNEKSLAHEAIDKANETQAWKLARNAQASNKLKEFESQNENYFLQVLNYKNIGGLITQQTDAKQQAIGNDWFKLANIYGEWLHSAKKENAHFMLPASLENRPQDWQEQAKLARWYLTKRDAKHAIEHLEIALEMNPNDNSLFADYGTALFISGDKKTAREYWAKIDDFNLYLETLTNNGLADEARTTLTKKATQVLGEYEGDDYEATQYGREKDTPKNLIRTLASSFETNKKALTKEEESAKAQFFLKLYETVPNTHLLAETLIKENLIQREHLTPFYKILIKSSDSLSPYNYDYNFSNYANGFSNAEESEEIYEHQNDFQIKEAEENVLSLQQAYLDLLIENSELKESQTLITEIEKELSGKYVRPVWLRLAKARLLLREKKTAQAVSLLRHLVGIETYPSVSKVLPPNVERLNQAVNVLNEEGFHKEALQLQESAYSRSIALGQFDSSSFAGLASIAFEKGEADKGLKFLQLMTRLGDEETSATTQNEISNLELIKSNAINDTTIEQPDSTNNIEIKNALSIAAQTASRWNQIEGAIEFRKQLLALSQDDAENRIELARLLSNNGKTDEAIETIAKVINDKTLTRTLRWQALWLSQEIVGDKKERWSKFAIKDKEFHAALNSLSLFQGGQKEEAINLTKVFLKTNPNPETEFFHALLLKQNGNNNEALEVFKQIIQSGRDARVSSSFGFNEDNALRQAISLYLSLSQPRAALKLAESDEDLKQVSFELPTEKYSTLERVAERQRIKNKLELLGKLAQAAEQVKEFDLAISYQNTLLNSSGDKNKKSEIEARINHLRGMKGSL